jgi:hypothetical protein
MGSEKHLKVYLREEINFLIDNPKSLEASFSHHLLFFLFFFFFVASIKSNIKLINCLSKQKQKVLATMQYKNRGLLKQLQLERTPTGGTHMNISQGLHLAIAWMVPLN